MFHENLPMAKKSSVRRRAAPAMGPRWSIVPSSVLCSSLSHSCASWVQVAANNPPAKVFGYHYYERHVAMKNMKQNGQFLDTIFNKEKKSNQQKNEAKNQKKISLTSKRNVQKNLNEKQIKRLQNVAKKKKIALWHLSATHDRISTEFSHRQITGSPLCGPQSLT